MKIVFYNHTGKVSGAERLLLGAAGRLDPREFERVMVCPDDGPLAELSGAAGLTTHSVATLEARFTWHPALVARYFISLCKAIRNFRRQLVALNPDLVHANSIRAGLVATFATFGLKFKVIWHLHDLLPRHPFSSMIRLVAALSRRSSMIAVSRAVKINFCGLLTRFLNRRVHVILNAIDLKSFKVDSGDREQVRRELSLANDEFAIGIVGQLTPRKGQLELLLAFADLLSKVPRARLVVAGAALFNRDEEYAEELRNTAERLGIAGRVKMLGARKDVPAIMRALDLLVVNSRHEPFGLVACEAMACGTAVLATDRDGLPEIIHHEQNGWLVPFGNRQLLVDALATASEHSEIRHRLTTVAKTDVAERFSLDRYIIELESFYRTLYTSDLADASATPARQERATSFAQ